MERRKPLSPNEFIKYVAKPINPKEMDIWVKSNNICIEKTQLFFDYICSLYNLMTDTYLGEDAIVTRRDVLGHFGWCWNTNLDNFKKENIFFSASGEHKEYLWTFFEDSFYKDSGENNIEKIDFYLNRLFKLYLQKTKSELDILKDLYTLLDKSLIFDNGK
jgi:hypothetical protein